MSLGKIILIKLLRLFTTALLGIFWLVYNRTRELSAQFLRSLGKLSPWMLSYWTLIVPKRSSQPYNRCISLRHLDLTVSSIFYKNTSSGTRVERGETILLLKDIIKEFYLMFVVIIRLGNFIFDIKRIEPKNYTYKNM